MGPDLSAPHLVEIDRSRRTGQRNRSAASRPTGVNRPESWRVTNNESNEVIDLVRRAAKRVRLKGGWNFGVIGAKI